MTGHDDDERAPRAPERRERTDHPGLFPAGLMTHAIERSLVVAGLTVCAAVAAQLAHLWWLVVLMPLAVFWLAASVATLIRTNDSVSLALYTLSWGILSTSWAVYARLKGVYPPQHHLLTWGALLIPVIVLAPAGALLWADYLAHLDEPAKPDPKDEAARALQLKLDSWTLAFEKIGINGVEAVKLDDNGDDGVEVELRLTGTTTVERIADPAVLGQLCVTRKLRRGAITIVPHESEQAERAVLTVDERDVLSQEIPFPEPAPGFYTTIERMHKIGRYRNGKDILVLFREVHAMVTGATRSGKSNFANVLIAIFIYCTDVVVWMADFKHGRTVAPWIRPWLDGEAKRPAIDYVATTRESATRMFADFDALCSEREANLKGGSKIHPDPDTPEVILICDESADVTSSSAGSTDIEEGSGWSNRIMSAMADKFAAKGASSALMLMMFWQRGTADKAGRTAIRANMLLKFLFRAESVDDIKAIIGGHNYLAAVINNRLRHRGSLVMMTGDGSVSDAGRIFELDYDEKRRPESCAKIRRMAIAAGEYRPAIEKAGRDVMRHYSSRWDFDADPVFARILDGRQPAPNTLTNVPRTATVMADDPAADSRRAAKQARPDQIDKTFAEMWNRLDLDDQAGALDDADPLEDAAGGSAAHALMLSLIRRNALDGAPLTAELILIYLRDAGHQPKPATVYRWLRDDVKLGKLRRFEGRDSKLRWEPADMRRKTGSGDGNSDAA